MEDNEDAPASTEIGDLSEEDIGHILTIIATDGYYKQAEIVKVVCPACGEEFLGTKRHQVDLSQGIVPTMSSRTLWTR